MHILPRTVAVFKSFLLFHQLVWLYPGYIVVQPATSSTVPLIDANVVGVPPFSDPNIRVYVLVVEKFVICNTYMLPSRDTFDQKYCENEFKALISPALLEVRRNGVVEPSVLSLYSPSLLVFPLTPSPILVAVASRYVLLGSITRTLVMASVELVKKVVGGTFPVVDLTLTVLEPSG